MQDLLHYPLRPYVAPFLRAHLPLLQSELLQLSRLMNQPLGHLIRQQPAYVLEPLPANRSFVTSQLSSHVFTALSAELEQLCGKSSHQAALPMQTQANHSAHPPTTAQSGSNPFKRRYSPDFHLQSLNASSLSPPLKIPAKHTSIPVSSTSTTNSLNSSSLHAQLTQARAAMLEELMTNGYQAQVAQQTNLVNQQLNQQFAAAHKVRLAQATLPTLPPLNVTGSSSFYSTIGTPSPSTIAHKTNLMTSERMVLSDRYDQPSHLTQNPTKAQIVSQTNGHHGSPFVRNGIGRESCMAGSKLSASSFGDFVSRASGATRRENSRASPDVSQRDNEDEWRNIYTVSLTFKLLLMKSLKI